MGFLDVAVLGESFSRLLYFQLTKPFSDHEVKRLGGGAFASDRRNLHISGAC